MKKRIAAVLIALSTATVFSACGDVKTENEGAKATAESTGNEVSDTAEQSGSSEASSDEVQSEGNLTNLEVETETKNVNKKIGNAVLSGKYTQFSLKTEGYDKLAEALESYSKDRGAEVEKNLASYEDNMAGEDDSQEDYKSNIFYESTSSAVRADSKVVSILENVYSYAGGAHPSTWYTTYTYDSKTGEELKLGDIVNDKSVLPEILDKELKKAYPEETFMEPENLKEDIETIMGYEGEVSEYAEEGAEPQRGLTFTLGNNGLTFYFSNYEIAPYAAGCQQVTLTFDEYPDLVKDEYKEHSENYITKFNDSIILENNEELKVDVSTSDDYDNEYTISVGDKSIKCQIYGFSNDNYLVHNGGKDYLYIQACEDNDYRHINIFSLDGNPEMLLATDLYFAFDYYPSDPANMRLCTHYDILSTYEGSRKYHVNDAGIPMADSDYDLIDSDVVLTLKKNLKAEVRNSAEDEKGEEETVSAGTKLSFYATNGTYVDLVTDDGRYVRVYPSTEGYPRIVDGQNEEDVFDGLMYAG
ncbi:MAG: DUF3298 and DUF4163 domain-containing protein [Lachnospiraceae bacterium]|nr:DUF3298 and DUF4163 domain-containing protein [Lachnospiraceae bacterium]